MTTTQIVLVRERVARKRAQLAAVQAGDTVAAIGATRPAKPRPPKPKPVVIDRRRPFEIPVTAEIRWAGDPAAFADLGIGIAPAATVAAKPEPPPLVHVAALEAPGAGTVDWGKQAALAVGTANHQPAGPTPRGAVISGAGKEKNRRQK